MKKPIRPAPFDLPKPQKPHPPVARITVWAYRPRPYWVDEIDHMRQDPELYSDSDLKK